MGVSIIAECRPTEVYPPHKRMDDTPTLIAYPFLWLNSRFAVGPWLVVPIEPGPDELVTAYGDGPDDSWVSEAFRERATEFLKRFFGTHNPREPLEEQRIEHPSIVVNRARGANGRPLTESERTALNAAVMFVALDTNPYPSEIESWHLPRVVAEHLDYWEIPLASHGWVSEPIGSRFRTLVTAPVNDDFGSYRVFAPRWMPVPPRVAPNQFLASAMYQAVANGTEDSWRLATAIRWWAKSWSNQAAEIEERIVTCGTSFECLLGSPASSGECRDGLNELFRSAHTIRVGGPAEAHNSDDQDRMLWSPDNSEQFCSWYQVFSDLRNNCAHRGDVRRDRQNSPVVALSAYEGLAGADVPNVFCDSPAKEPGGGASPVADRVLCDVDRVLREAIKAKLIICNDDPNTDQDTRSCVANSILSQSFADIYQASGSILGV